MGGCLSPSKHTYCTHWQRPVLPSLQASISPLWPGTHGGGGGKKPVTGGEDVKKSGVLTTCPHRSEEAGRIELPFLPWSPDLEQVSG